MHSADRLQPALGSACPDARIRKTWLAGPLRVANLGQAVDLTYPAEQLGTGSTYSMRWPTEVTPSRTCWRTPSGDADPGHGGVGARRRCGDPPSRGEAARETGMIGPAGTPAEAAGFGFNVLHTAASRVAALDLGFVPGEGGRDVAGIVDGAQKGEIDSFICSRRRVAVDHLGRAFNRLSGQPRRRRREQRRRDPSRRGVHREGWLFVNFEGRVQEAQRATFPPATPRGLGDPAGAVGNAGPAVAVRQSGSGARGDRRPGAA